MIRMMSSHWRKLAGLAVVMLAALGTWSIVQADPPATPPAPGPTYRSPPAGPPAARFRDPTQPSPEMRSAIEAEQFVPKPNDSAPAAPALPTVTLKARLIGSRGQPTAVIDVGGRTFTVHPDSEVPGSGASTIVVRQISDQGVQVEVLPLKKTIHLN